MHTRDTIDRLASSSLFNDVPRADLEWLVSHGEVVTYAADTIVRSTGAPIEEMSIILEGRVGLYAEKAGVRRKVSDAGPDYVLGVMPYSRFRQAPGLLVVEEATTAFVLHQRFFPELMRERVGLTTALVRHMLDRARDYRAVQLQDERLQSLGRLASGLAHELNNPASAAARNAQSLAALLDDAERAGRALAAARLSADQLSAIDAVRAACNGPTPARTAIESADREDDLADWLDAHGLDGAAAASLACTDLELEALDRLAALLPPDALRAAIQWVAASNTARDAARQIENATGRIHDVVGAIRGFTFMDREGVPEQVDVARGLADTIAVLENKLRAKSVAVQIETAPDLPRVHGIGSQINQVWEKVIDNAIDAVGRDGHITITASSRNESVLVRVMDDGTGIPEDIRSRVFDPFFTTKPVGKGTGLGLDMARRLVHLHGGDIDFTTQPGRTVFRVRLPIHGARTN